MTNGRASQATVTLSKVKMPELTATSPTAYAPGILFKQLTRRLPHLRRQLTLYFTFVFTRYRSFSLPADP